MQRRPAAVSTGTTASKARGAYGKPCRSTTGGPSGGPASSYAMSSTGVRAVRMSAMPRIMHERAAAGEGAGGLVAPPAGGMVPPMLRRRSSITLLTGLFVPASRLARAQTGPQPRLPTEPLVIATRDGAGHEFRVEMAVQP